MALPVTNAFRAFIAWIEGAPSRMGYQNMEQQSLKSPVNEQKCPFAVGLKLASATFRLGDAGRQNVAAGDAHAKITRASAAKTVGEKL